MNENNELEHHVSLRGGTGVWIFLGVARGYFFEKIFR
jgi:hypothetical protein